MTAPETHPASIDVETLLTDCDIQRTRGSGPGGQHRNKVESAIVITHRPTGIIGQASERRSQHDNRRQAIDRLRIGLAVGYRVPVESTAIYKTSALWQSRVRSGRISVSANHHDFPAMLAESLDVLSACHNDAVNAGQVLNCTASQLIKLVKKESSALEMVNRHRIRIGASPYQ